MIKIAINGFGRIGRQSFKIALERDDVDIIAINDLLPSGVLSHLLTYDSVYGIYPKDVKVEVDGQVVSDEGAEDPESHLVDYTGKEVYLIVGSKKIKLISEPDPTKLPWGEMKIDVVLECTGRFTKNGEARKHIEAGAKKVIISAPSKGEDDINTYLMGVNNDKLRDDDVISNGSCTTNCVGPVTALMHSNFGIEKAMMSTIHAYTSTQALIDGAQKPKDLRRLRAAATNIIPTSTGAAVATTEALPELKGKFDGMAFRVPVLNGSVSDFTFLLKKNTTAEEINQMFTKASEQNPMFKNVLQVTNEPIVSSDIIGNTASAIVDLSLTKVVDGNLAKVVAWYDNEFGYSARLIDMAVEVAKKLI